MTDTDYRRYVIDAPTKTHDALRKEFHPDVENYPNAMDGDKLVVIGPAGEDPGPLADTFPTDPVQEFINDNNLECEMISSRPIRKPSELPSKLQDTKTVREVMGNIAIAPYIEDAINGDDPREYSLQGRIRFDVTTAFDGSPRPDPLPPETIESLINDGLTEDDEGIIYPSGKQILAWNTDLQTEFDNVKVCGVGQFLPPMTDWEDGMASFDGVAITTQDGSSLATDVVEWVTARFYHEWDDEARKFVMENEDYLNDYNLSPADEFVLSEDGIWLRMWWD